MDEPINYTRYELCDKYGVSPRTFNRWRQCAGIEAKVTPNRRYFASEIQKIENFVLATKKLHLLSQKEYYEQIVKTGKTFPQWYEEFKQKEKINYANSITEATMSESWAS